MLELWQVVMMGSGLLLVGLGLRIIRLS